MLGIRTLFCSDRSGTLVARVGVPLADVYLEFLSGRCGRNTVRAAAYDLKVFFTAVAMPPDQVRPADVLGFITAQRIGQAGGRGVLQPLKAGDEAGRACCQHARARRTAPREPPAPAALRGRDRRAAGGDIPRSAAQRPPRARISSRARLAAHRHRCAAASPQVAAG